MRLLLIALFFEVGIVLAFVPWSAYWERNYFAESVPLIHSFITNNFVRGAVSGLGVVNLVVAATELLAIFSARRAAEPYPSLGHTSILEDK